MSMAHCARTVAFSAILLVAGPATADNRAEICQEAFEDAPAQDYCSNESFSWIDGAADRKHCYFLATCTVSVNIGDDEENTAFSNNFGNLGTLEQMSQLNLCFKESADGDSKPGTGGGYVMSVRAGCTSEWIDLDTALSEGLPALD